MITDTTTNPHDDEFVIRFHAEWCGPCKSFAPVYEAASAETTIPFYEVDVDAAPELAGQYNVRSIPAAFYVVRGEGIRKLDVVANPQLFNKQLG